MQLSTKGRYALQIMIDIAQNQKDGCVSLRCVSTRLSISVKYIEQIVHLLRTAGKLRSIKGARGGYTLAKDAEDYTIGEILTATEGPFCTAKEQITGDPPLSGDEYFWQRLDILVLDFADSFSLHQLAFYDKHTASRVVRT